MSRDILVLMTTGEGFSHVSISAVGHDRGKKFHHYQQLTSLQEYILIAQVSPRIERFLRQDDGTWLLTNVTGLESRLPPALNLFRNPKFTPQYHPNS